MSNQHPQQPETAAQEPSKTTPAKVEKPKAPAADVPTFDKPRTPDAPPGGWERMERGKEYRLPSGNTIINN